MFIWLAIWVSGIVNWREYWMKACTSPSDMRARGHPVATEHGDHDVVDVGEELHRRLDDARQELRPEARLVQPSVLAAELVDRGRAAAEHLDQRVAGVGLLDQPVQRAGLVPLGRELDLGASARSRKVITIASGIVTADTAASSGEIQNIMPAPRRSSAPR